MVAWQADRAALGCVQMAARCQGNSITSARRTLLIECTKGGARLRGVDDTSLSETSTFANRRDSRSSAASVTHEARSTSRRSTHPGLRPASMGERASWGRFSAGDRTRNTGQASLSMPRLGAASSHCASRAPAVDTQTIRQRWRPNAFGGLLWCGGGGCSGNKTVMDIDPSGTIITVEQGRNLMLSWKGQLMSGDIARS